MNLAGYQDVIAKDADTALKVNISWHFFFPGSSTTPWQLDGVIRAMKQDGYDPSLIHACHNRTVVIDAHLGERENKQLNVVEAHGLRNIHIYETEEWINIRDAVGDLTKKFPCLNEVYPKGFMIPKRFIGENIIHLPTVKTHVFTTTTGAMKNAFGGLLNEHRHWTHPVIHETLVDLLMIQKKIHRGVFAVMDGTFAGDGPGPRCMMPYVEERHPRQRRPGGDRRGRGEADGLRPDVDQVHPAGARDGPRAAAIRARSRSSATRRAANENWHFVGPFKKMTFASRMQHQIYWGPLKKPIEWSLKTVLAPWAYIASVVYHDSFWYPMNAKRAMQEVLDGPWGRLFRNWETVRAGCRRLSRRRRHDRADREDRRQGAAAIGRDSGHVHQGSAGVRQAARRHARRARSELTVNEPHGRLHTCLISTSEANRSMSSRS